MSDPRSSVSSGSEIHVHLQDIAERLQGTIDVLRAKADHIAGDMPEHDSLLRVGHHFRIDEALACIVAELRAFARLDQNE